MNKPKNKMTAITITIIIIIIILINNNKKVGTNVDVGSKPADCSARVFVACCDWDQCLYNMR